MTELACRQGRKSDAILSCPGCLTTVCIDCQQHAVFENQFRAMFTMNCRCGKPMSGCAGSALLVVMVLHRDSGLHIPCSWAPDIGLLTLYSVVYIHSRMHVCECNVVI